MRWQKILCPVDFSEGSRQAFQIAVDLAKDRGGTVVLLHVFSDPERVTAEVFFPPDVVARVLSEGEARLEAWKLEAGADAPVEVRQVAGTAYDQIVRVAAELPADLIVMGTRGATGLAHMLIGSVAEKVVRHAPCPVLVTRHPGG